MRALSISPLLLALSVTCSSTWAARQDRDTVIYSLHVGVNAAPAGSALEPLKYADDDAARFFSFIRPFAAQAHLFTVLDLDSQRRYGSTLGLSRPPRIKELSRALSQIRQALLVDQRAGRRTVVYFSYSGHGVKAARETKLALLDGLLDRRWLESHVMRLPADYIHLFLDACHAEGVIKSRGVVRRVARARSRPLSLRERREFFRDDTLTRHPNVGALLASSSDQETHEWSRLESGVFTHEVLSALAGAADVNQDGEIAYSELAAFISAANRSITNRQAAVAVISLPPRINHNAPIFARTWINQPSLLSGVPHSAGHFFLETEQGVRLLDAHTDENSTLTLLVPAGQPLWMRRGQQEAKFEVRKDSQESYSRLRFRPSDQRARGSVASSLAEGLFKTPFGRDYYRGWVDSRGEPSVGFIDRSGTGVPPGTAQKDRPDGLRADRVSRTPAALCLAAGGAALASTVVMSVLAVRAKADYDSTDLEGPAQDAADRYHLFSGLAIGSGATTLILAGLGWWLWPQPDREKPRLQTFSIQKTVGGFSARLGATW